MKWEYKTIKIATTGFAGGKLSERTFTAYMNELGEKEWGLVTAFDTKQIYGATRNVVAVFKRH